MVKALEGLDFRRNPDLPEARIRKLADGGYIDSAGTVFDRLTHRSHIIDTGKRSIRLEEAMVRRGRIATEAPA